MYFSGNVKSGDQGTTFQGTWSYSGPCGGRLCPRGLQVIRKDNKTEASEVAMRREAEKAADLQQQLQATISLYKREMSLRKKYHNELCQLRGCYSCMQSMVWGLGRVIHCCYACILHYSTGWPIFICAHWVVCTFQEMLEWWPGYVLPRKAKLQWSMWRTTLSTWTTGDPKSRSCSTQYSNQKPHKQRYSIQTHTWLCDTHDNTDDDRHNDTHIFVLLSFIWSDGDFSS